MIRCLFVGTLLILDFKSFAQEKSLPGSMFNDLEVTSSLTRSYRDSTINFHVKIIDDNHRTDMGKRYYWFNQGEVKSTQGNYTGKLLHGPFEKFDRQGNLVEKGSYEYGLKVGLWTRWYKNGSVATTYQWQNGWRDGQFKEFFENGQLSKVGFFKKDKLDGVTLTYDKVGNQIAQRTYKNGIIKSKKERIQNVSGEDKPKRKDEKKDSSSTRKKVKKKKPPSADKLEIKK